MTNNKLKIFSWALYDFANAVFAMNAVALYFALWVTVDKGAEDIVYSFTLGLSMLLAGLSMPLLGAVSDKRGNHMPFLIFFTVLSVVFLAILGAVDNLLAGLIIFAVSNLGYLVSGAVFYNALLADVSDGERIGRVSGYGISLSYVGTITGLFLIRPIVLRYGYQAAFVPTALVFLLFALPCFLFVKDKARPKPIALKGLLGETLNGLKNTARSVMASKTLFNFFMAIFIIINTVNALFIFMSVYLKKTFLFTDSDIMALYIFSNFFSIAGAVASGYLTDRIGAKKTLTAAALLCAAAALLAAVSPSKHLFWIVGPAVGLAFSSIRVSGRALAIELFPKEMIGEIFGHLGFLANFAFLGLLVWGGVVYLCAPLGTAKYRVALGTLVFILLAGISALQKAAKSGAEDLC